jgi:hypothetical protein
LQGFPTVIPLEDDTYEVIVVDASQDMEKGPEVVHLELAVITGRHKGEVVRLNGYHLAGDPFDLLGLPATLTVTDGVPTFQLDRS